MRKIFTYFIFLTTVTALFTQCRLREDKEWDLEALVPIAHSDLSIRNLISDTLLKENSDKSLKLVNVQKFNDLEVGDFLEIPDSTLEKSVSLKTISLGERQLKRDITLGEVARNAGFTGQLILVNHGKKMKVPALTGLSTGAVDVDAQSFFKSATFIDGKLKLEIKNGFPIELTDVHFQLKNKAANTIVVEDNISSIKSDEAFVKIYSLAGKTVEGTLVANILNMNSPGSGNDSVLIDTTDALGITITAYDMQVFEAEAIFPAQYLVNDSVDIAYDLDGAKLTFMTIKTGEIVVTAAHTIQEKLYLNYGIPSAKKDGVPLSESEILNASLNGDTVKRVEIFPVDNYDVDLRGRKQDTFNTFFNTLSVRIDSSGQLRKLSLKDSIYLFYGLVNVVPKYARGYLGQKTYTFMETEKFDVFKNFTGGRIGLEDLKVSLELKNGIGAPAVVRINSLIAYNTKEGIGKALEGSVVDQDIAIAPATDNPFTPQYTTITLDKNTSNISDLLSILPDQLEYNMEVKLNPAGNTGAYNDFIYSESTVDASINIELPLNVSAKGLTLVDTANIELTEAAMDRIQSGTLNLLAENSYPLAASIQLYILDNEGQVTDSLTTPGQNTIMAGMPDAQTYRVEQPAKSRIGIYVDEQKWERLRQARRLIVKVTMDSAPAGQPVRIFSDSELKVKLTGDLKYRSTF